MTRENISRLILDAGNGDEEWAIIAKQLHKHFPDELEAFAALVASAERERIKQANAPEIERINAHIKELEDALAQREQDGECKYCTDGCPACDARKLPKEYWVLLVILGVWVWSKI